MELSSTFCRMQETVQRDRAADAILANIRPLAEKAARAWGAMALLAEQSEARRERTRIVADLAALQNESVPSEEDGSMSENPDRAVEGRRAMALLAEQSEARRERARIVADLAALQNEPVPSEEDRSLSENPDRGVENP